MPPRALAPLAKIASQAAGVGEVADGGDGAAAGGSDRLRGFLGRCGADVGDDDAGALGREFERGGAADAAAGTADECAFSA